MTDAELNEAVAREVMGWVRKPHPDNALLDISLTVWTEGGGQFRQIEDWSPVTDIADAMEVVEKILLHNYVCVMSRHPTDRGWTVEFSRESRWFDWDELLSRAISGAALKAVRTESESRS